MASGKVKWFDSKKGYGFILPEGGGNDLFVHYSGVAAEGFKTLNEGDSVEYNITEGKKGPMATEVKKVS